VSPRVYERKFDWDEARQLYVSGVALKDIAERFGVTYNAVRLAVNDEARKRAREYLANWQRSGVCPDCGTQTTRRATTGDTRCIDCASRRRATSVRSTALLCSGCRKWKPDDDFPLNRVKRGKQRRGRHNFCRACSTKARQDYRERHKVPCVSCGKPALPPSEKGTHGAAFPRCRSCQIRDMWRERKQAV
jgi:ribosomal protein L37AE/L43A